MDLKSLFTNPYIVSLLFSSIVTLILYYSRDKETKTPKPMSYYIFIFIVSTVSIYSAFYMYKKIGGTGTIMGAGATASVISNTLTSLNDKRPITPETPTTPEIPTTPKKSLLYKTLNKATTLLGGSKEEETVELTNEPIMVGMLE